MLSSKKFKSLQERSKQTGLSELAIYLLKVVSDLREELEEYIEMRTSHVLVSTHKHTTVGGAVTEVIPYKKASPDKTVFANLEEQGAVPVEIVSVKMEYGEIHVTFSADPGSDHKINIMIVK